MLSGSTFSQFINSSLASGDAVKPQLSSFSLRQPCPAAACRTAQESGQALAPFDLAWHVYLCVLGPERSAEHTEAVPKCSALVSCRTIQEAGRAHSASRHGAQRYRPRRLQCHQGQPWYGSDGVPQLGRAAPQQQVPCSKCGLRLLEWRYTKRGCHLGAGGFWLKF